MKSHLLAFAVLLLYIPMTWGCSGIVASDHFKYVAENPDVDDATREWAHRTYLHMEMLRDRRNSASGGEGITEQGGDDQDFNQEQDPAYASSLQAERQALKTHDKDTPQPALEPPNPPTLQESGPIHERKRSLTTDEMTDSVERLIKRSLPRRQANSLQRFTYTDYNTCFKDPPFALVRKEGGAPAEDVEVNLVYTGLGLTDNLFRKVYGRTNILLADGAVHGTARYCDKLGNAFWDGTQTLFGEGDGYMFNVGSFTRSLSVAAHEVTHGIIQYTNPLKYQGQTGALNEHLSDVFGILASMYAFGTTSANSDWLIGPGLVRGGRAVRDMAAPGTAYNTTTSNIGPDRQVANMANYFTGPQDDYGVHVNSGIPNHAFYLFSVAVGGRAWNVPGRIWYNVLNQGQGKFDETGETFKTFAQRTVKAATQLYGASTATQLRRAWTDVGVL